MRRSETVPQQISLSDCEILRTLGDGSIGRTCLVNHIPTSKLFAMQFANKVDHFPSETSAVLNRLTRISHPSLLPLTGFALPEEQTPLILCSAYIEKGSFASVLESGVELTNLEKMKLLFGVAEAMRYLGSVGLSHRALVPTNVLIEAGMRPRLTGYGLSFLRSGAGTPFDGRVSAESIDGFCYGAFAYSVLTGRVYDAEDLPALSEVPREFQSLVGGCWSEQRNDFEAIVVEFFKPGMSLPLSEGELVEFRQFQGTIMPHSFALSLLREITARIQRVADRTEYLFELAGTAKQDLARSQAKGYQSLPSLNLMVIQGSPGLRPDSSRAFMRLSEPFIVRPPPLPTISQPKRVMIDVGGSLQEEQPIFAQLNEKYGGNVAELGIVTISGNSVDESRERGLPHLLEPNWTKCWTSKNDKHSWLQFDFHGMNIIISSYTIKTYPLGRGFSHMRSWTLQGSVDGVSWIDLDTRVNTSELNGRSKTGVFTLAGPTEVRSLKLKQTGPNHADDHYMILTNVEFYGAVLSKD
jgi:serine/threonine protein kinase